MSNFTLNIGKYTIWDLGDWRVSIYLYEKCSVSKFITSTLGVQSLWKGFGLSVFVTAIGASWYLQ